MEAINWKRQKGRLEEYGSKEGCRRDGTRGWFQKRTVKEAIVHYCSRSLGRRYWRMALEKDLERRYQRMALEMYQERRYQRMAQEKDQEAVLEYGCRRELQIEKRYLKRALDGICKRGSCRSYGICLLKGRAQSRGLEDQERWRLSG